MKNDLRFVSRVVGGREVRKDGCQEVITFTRLSPPYDKPVVTLRRTFLSMITSEMTEKSEC